MWRKKTRIWKTKRRSVNISTQAIASIKWNVNFPTQVKCVKYTWKGENVPKNRAKTDIQRSVNVYNEKVVVRD